MKHKLIFINVLILLNFYKFESKSNFSNLLRSKQNSFVNIENINSLNSSPRKISMRSTYYLPSESVNEHDNLGKKFGNANCYVILDNYVFDINPLSQYNFQILGKDGSLNFFNFCKNIQTTCKDRSGLFVNNDNCSIFSGSSIIDKNGKFKMIKRKDIKN
jgi:hypothetical protein